MADRPDEPCERPARLIGDDSPSLRRFALTITFLLTLGTAFAAEAPRYRVGVCDWMILKRQKLGAFPLAKDIGADGVEVDMGSLGDRPTFDSKLGDPAVQQQFLAKARELGLGISSIAMSGFYAQAFAERPDLLLLNDCFATAKAMGVKVLFLPLGVQVLFLPLGVQDDLTKRPELRPEIVRRLRVAGRVASADGLTIGIETSLDAQAEAALLDEIGLTSVKSYFNLANALEHGRDVCAELKILGKDRIVQIHASNHDGVWLQNDPQVDLPRIKATLDEMGWSGWLVIERSRDATHTGAKDVTYNYGANAAYLKQVFQPKS